MSAIKWGILGASNIAFDFVQALQTLPASEHEVVAVGSTSLEWCKEFCQDLGIPKSYGSYEELCADNEVQVVYVASYADRHAKLIELALNNNKPCLCETPICTKREELQRVAKLAREKKVLLMEAVWSRFLPPWTEAMKMIQEGRIGKVQAVIGSMGLALGSSIEAFYSAGAGGGSLIQFGGYLLNLTDMVFGGDEPLKMVGTGHKFEAGVDSTVGINILYSGNRIAHLLSSADTDLPNDFKVIGTKGSITIKAPCWASIELETPDGPKRFPLPPTDKPINYENEAGLRYEIAAFGEYIKSKKLESDVMPLATSERILGWIDDIRTQMGCSFT